MVKRDMEEFVFTHRWKILLGMVGLILLGLGVSYFVRVDFGETKVEIIEDVKEENEETIVVEVSGSVKEPGVYEFLANARVGDAINSAGGLSNEADLEWMEKSVNRAARLRDGQKIYIKSQSEVLSANSEGSEFDIDESIEGSGLKSVNINEASQKELESLWGIGPVYAQNIIEHRPYSDVEELLSKKVIKQNVYERNKEKLTIY